MNLVTKIAKLTRVPQILRRKHEAAERDSKKKREESNQRPPFPLKDQALPKKPAAASYPSKSSSSQVSADPPKTTGEGIGNRIDVTI